MSPHREGGTKGKGTKPSLGGDLHINFPILWKLLLQSNTVNSVFSTKKNDYPSVGGIPYIGKPCIVVWLARAVITYMSIWELQRS